MPFPRREIRAVRRSLRPRGRLVGGRRRGVAPGLWLLAACLLAGVAVGPARAAGGGPPDRDGNGVEDLLDDWAAGRVGWGDLVARACADREDPAAKRGGWPDGVAEPGPGPLARGELRLLRLGGDAAATARAAADARAAGGVVRSLHRLSRFGGVEVLAVDPAGLRALLAAPGAGRLVLDRDGTPALDRSSVLCGALIARAGPWRVEGDWTASVAILDSGCDTAHDDLGDFSHDNRDGPPPYVGDALDWSSAAAGWPLFLGYKVVGWHDVTDDFPLAVGPWDYHWHGTALAGVVAGAGGIDARYRGIAPVARLTIVKFYDFDGVWRQWQGDFLAACAWLLDHRGECRVRVALCAVGWDVDLGLGAAMDELRAAGILPVVAMGNGGADLPPGYPASLPSVISVGAVNDAAELAGTSGRGRGTDGKPDLVAPGGGVLPAAGGIDTTDNESDDSYSERWGTSLAAAHVAAGAFLLLEALRKEGWPDAGPAAEDLVSALLRGTAAPVLRAETADGADRVALAPWLSAPDSARGWGLLQVPAAIEALLSPLAVGGSAVDSLGGVGGRRTLARRLSLLPGRSCVVEAAPSAGLDIALEIHDSRRLIDPGEGLPAVRADAAGVGGAERAGFRAPDQGFCFVAVKRIAGTGRVTVTLRDAPDAADPAWTVTLGGGLAGWPVAAAFGTAGAPALVCTGGATIDPQARLVHALDGTGRERAGWPVSIFLPSTLQGPLTAPLAWNLDGVPGDELAVGSAFGKLYLLSGTGSYVAVDVAGTNVALTAPVGRERPDGGREVAVVSAAGVLTRE
ncbi:MAG: S8 family serine peptidase, partial [Candidatus Krumholzibacteriia bacterium]